MLGWDDDSPVALRIVCSRAFPMALSSGVLLLASGRILLLHVSIELSLWATDYVYVLRDCNVMDKDV